MTVNSTAGPDHQLIQDLRQKIQSVTTAGRASDGTAFTSGCPAINRILPGGGYSRGTIVQWFNPPSHNLHYPAGGHGAELLSLLAAKNACQDGQAIVVVDPDHTFNPRAAVALGVSLDNLVLLRPETVCHNHKSNDLFWAIDQSLRSTAVGAVWGAVGHANPRWLRRFQLSAEQTGSVGFFIRPHHCASRPNWSEVDWQVDRRRSAEGGIRQIPLHLLRAPGGCAGRRITIEFNPVSGSVQAARNHHEESTLFLASQLANPTPRRRATTA